MSLAGRPQHQWNSRGSIVTFFNKRFLGLPVSTSGSALIESGTEATYPSIRGEWQEGGCVRFLDHLSGTVIMTSQRGFQKRPLLAGFLPLPRMEVQRFMLPNQQGELTVGQHLERRAYYLNDQRIDLEQKHLGWGVWCRFSDFDLYAPYWTSKKDASLFSWKSKEVSLLAAICAYVERTALQRRNAG